MYFVDQEQLAVDIARSFITQAAPQELPLFEGISNEFLRNPSKAFKQRVDKDELLGFGAGEAVSLLTPIALTIATTVLTSLTQKATETLGAKIVSLFKRLFKRSGRTKATILLPLTPEQLKQVHEQTIVTAHRFKVPNKQAQLMADALVGRLVTGGTERKP